MNKGWFKQKNIKPGTVIEGLPRWAGTAWGWPTSGKSTWLHGINWCASIKQQQMQKPAKSLGRV